MTRLREVALYRGWAHGGRWLAVPVTPRPAAPWGRGRAHRVTLQRGGLYRWGVSGPQRPLHRRACFGNVGLTAPPSLPAAVPDFGRFTSIPEGTPPLQTPSLEDLLCSHAPLCSDATSPGCAAASQAFLSPPEPRAPRVADRKLSPLMSPLQDPLADRTLLEPRDVVRSKKVCFSESSLPSGDRTRRSYYLNGTARGGLRVGTHAAAGSWGGQPGTASLSPSTGGPVWPGARLWGCVCSDL